MSRFVASAWARRRGDSYRRLTLSTIPVLYPSLDYTLNVVNRRRRSRMTDPTIVVVRVEHPVPDYEIWKREAFDQDPLGRAPSGVRRHRVLRRGERPSRVAVELEF